MVSKIFYATMHSNLKSATVRLIKCCRRGLRLQASTKKGSKMTSLVNYRLRITINDGRQFVGQMLAFDKHMNLVIADTEEFRVVRKKRSKE